MDEFDRLQDENVSRLMADTVDDLLKEHQAIDSCLVQVQMPRMSLPELADILYKGLSQLGMGIEDSASEFITYLSHGLPHYTHLLGLASGRAALVDGQMDIRIEDAGEAIRSSWHHAQRSIMAGYDAATSSPRQESLFEEVLLACALAPVDDLGYFSAGDIRRPMSPIMGRQYEIPAFARHLDRFCDPERGAVLEKSGRRYRYRFRFANPLMQPYVLIRGLYLELVSIEMMGELREAESTDL